MNEMFERALEFFQGHKRAYQQTFNKTSPAVQYVLADLCKFCHGNDTSLLPGADRDDVVRNEGRRQVWLRLQRALNLTPQEMFQLARQTKETAK